MNYNDWYFSKYTHIDPTFYAFGEMAWQAAQAAEVPECVWTCDDDVHMPDTWDGECGAKWSFIDGGPKDNEMNYCPQCGGKVVVAAPKPEDVK